MCVCIEERLTTFGGMYKPHLYIAFSCMFVTCKALLVLCAASVSAWSQLAVDSKSVGEEDSRATKQDAHAPRSMRHSPRIICRWTCRTDTCARACGVHRHSCTHSMQHIHHRTS